MKKSKKIDKSKILNFLKSKTLIILYIEYFVEQWENDFYYQCQGMWIAHKRRYKKFSTYLLYQLLNKNRSIVLTRKFNSYFIGWMNATVKWKLQVFIDFCKEKKIFSRILEQDLANIKLVQIILGFNLFFFNLLPFSVNQVRQLIVRRRIYVKYLLAYMELPNKERQKHLLYCDLKQLKLKSVSEVYKKQLSLKKKNVYQQLEICKTANFL